MLAGGHADAVLGVHDVADSLVTEDIIWGRWLLNPPGLERCEVLHPINSLFDTPLLIGVYHQETIRANDFAHCGEPRDIGSNVRAHLDLDVFQPSAHSLCRKLTNLLSRILDPALQNGSHIRLKHPWESTGGSA
jgi:hypothetical protein